MKKSVNVWMQMFGFEKNDADRGAERFLNRMGFVPKSIHALLFHPDFFHLHRGMGAEYPLFKDNCSYRAVPRNTERERQDWTNYDLRALIANLKARGVKFYASVFGTYVENIFHREWLSDHPEMRCAKLKGDGHLMCLKRLKDGTYYEDFFSQKLVETMVDYDLAGVHLADTFCPSEHLYKSDYSSDMAEQFLAHSKRTELEDALLIGDDSLEARRVRQAVLWGNLELREEWIRFYEWRWEGFFKKICDAVHAVGREVWVLGMYCSDPFETEYVYGFDTRRVMDAGVDCITANIVPTSVYHETHQFPDLFHKIHMTLPLLRAQVKDHSVVTMLSVQDASEEFSVIDHLPVRLERDAYTMTAFCGRGEKSCESATEGFYICLGDGLTSRQWEFLKERMEIGFSADAEFSWSPMIYWSDEAERRMLHEYLSTRRPTPHKQCTEIFRAGVPFGGSVRSDRLKGFEGSLFVPNFDLLSEAEKEELATYGGAWVGTVPADFDLGPYGIIPTFDCKDRFSDYPLRAFACGFDLTEADKASIDALCAVDDGALSRADEPECDIHPPVAELPFRKLTKGFVEACAVILKAMTYTKFAVSSSMPMLALRMKNGFDRLFLFNKYDDAYTSARVVSEANIEDSVIVSAFPVLPVRFFADEESERIFLRHGLSDYEKEAGNTARKIFSVKLAPCGLTIIDVKRGEA
ncbi:MAG: hypothetical protein IKJ35_02965 [Clostridia bacterium]|nr:hypothetical protein [Clostridia bacterium]